MWISLHECSTFQKFQDLAGYQLVQMALHLRTRVVNRCRSGRHGKGQIRVCHAVICRSN